MIKLGILKLNIENKIKFNKLGVGILVLLLGFFYCQKSILAKENNENIIITEIMYNPEGSDNKKEWIEVLNNGSEEIDLNKWILIESSKKKVKHKIESENGDSVLESGEYMIIAENSKNFLDEHRNFKGKVFDSSFSLSNNNEKITLINPDNNISANVEYFKKWGADGNGYSLELDNSKWRQSYIAGGTPGEENSKKPKPKKYSKEIRINEVFPDPEKNESENEWIELYNFGDKNINLESWTLKDKGGKKFKLEGEIKSGEYLVFYNTVSLNNSGDKIELENPNGKIIDEVEYNKSQENFSYNYDDRDKKWKWSTFLTPESKNKFDEDIIYSNKIRINEILPNPKGEENENEFVELYNFGKEKVNLNKWILKDDSKTGKYIFSEDKIIKSGGYLKIYRKDFKFALNNSGGEIVYLLNPRGEEIFKVKYNSAKENISYGYDTKNNKWRWSKFLTPGVENKFDKIPEIKINIDNEVYENIYANFKIKGVDSEKLKIKWDFGDGRKSYKKETRHKYKKEGEYKVITNIFNGSEEFEFVNIVKVRKYPRRDVEIISFMPNPEGKDIEGEWIEIKNNYKKKIDLNGWSIATGKDKKSLVNHPINEKFKIKSDELVKITREYSYFSLNNKEGYIEIRYPDGKVADKVSYENKNGIKDNDIYQKGEDGEWGWIVFKNEITEKASQNQKPEVKGEMIINEDILKNIGKISWVEIDKNYIFSKYKLNKKIISLIWKNSKVVRVENNTYHFNPVAKKQKHYIVKFFEDVFSV